MTKNKMNDDKDIRGAGGTPGGVGQFLFGLGLVIAGGYLFLERVTVVSGYWQLWGYNAFGLSLIPLLLALYAFRRRHAVGQDNGGSYVAVGLAIIGAVVLLSHQHPNHPGLDVVNIQHRFFAGTCLLIAFSLLQEARGRWVGNNKRLIFPTLLILLSLQLTWYTE